MFFSVTKLFQNKDINLRRMVYLCIKDICPSADEVIIVTSSLMKDMNSKTDLYRANAVRVLCKIIDSQLLMQVGACAACMRAASGRSGRLQQRASQRHGSLGMQPQAAHACARVGTPPRAHARRLSAT